MATLLRRAAAVCGIYSFGSPLHFVSSSVGVTVMAGRLVTVMAGRLSAARAGRMMVGRMVVLAFTGDAEELDRVMECPGAATSCTCE
jgi:hypothetical protein